MRDLQELKLAIASKEMWLHLSEELDFDLEYRRIGLLMTAYTEERMNECRAWVAREQPAGLDVRMVNMDEVRKLVPNVSFEDGIDGHEYLGASYCPKSRKKIIGGTPDVRAD
jgi:sarcosine oxidase subunit beta